MHNCVNPAEVLRAAAQHMDDRAATYDAPSGERSMEKTVDMFNALIGGDRLLSTEQGWMFMAILKIVRSQQGAYKLDNYEDLAAYAALAAEEAYRMRSTPEPIASPTDRTAHSPASHSPSTYASVPTS